MTITLFSDKNFKGRQLVVNQNSADLGDTSLGRNPSSITMDKPQDAVLLFKGKDWDGGVMCFRGQRFTASLGKTSQGGELLAGNTVASVRVTPFTLKLNISVVTSLEDPEDLKSPMRYPGDMDDEDELRITLEKAVGLVNGFFLREHAMLNLKVATIHFRMNPGLFSPGTTSVMSSVPGDWKEKGQVDVIVVHKLRDAAVGAAAMPWWGQIIVVEIDDRVLGAIARTLAHELGHHLGLSHGSGNGVARNIMTQSALGLSLDESALLDEQIEEMQQKLARNLTRQGERID